MKWEERGLVTHPCSCRPLLYFAIAAPSSLVLRPAHRWHSPSPSACLADFAAADSCSAFARPAVGRWDCHQHSRPRSPSTFRKPIPNGPFKTTASGPLAQRVGPPDTDHPAEFGSHQHFQAQFGFCPAGFA